MSEQRCELCGSAVTIVGDARGFGSNHYVARTIAVDDYEDEKAFRGILLKANAEMAATRDFGFTQYEDKIAEHFWQAALAYARKGTNADQ